MYFPGTRFVNCKSNAELDRLKQVTGSVSVAFSQSIAICFNKPLSNHQIANRRHWTRAILKRVSYHQQICPITVCDNSSSCEAIRFPGPQPRLNPQVIAGSRPVQGGPFQRQRNRMSTSSISVRLLVLP